MERALHMQLYPNWSARSNYATSSKKKRKREPSAADQTQNGGKRKARISCAYVLASSD